MTSRLRIRPSRTLTNLDLKVCHFLYPGAVGVKAGQLGQPERQLQHRRSKPHEKKSFTTNPLELNKSEPSRSLALQVRRETQHWDTLVEILAVECFKVGSSS